MKSNLKYNSKVKFHSTSSADLDGKTGKILGLLVAHAENNYWIVGLDTPLEDRSALVITDSCISLVKE